MQFSRARALSDELWHDGIVYGSHFIAITNPPDELSRRTGYCVTGPIRLFIFIRVSNSHFQIGTESKLIELQVISVVCTKQMSCMSLHAIVLRL